MELNWQKYDIDISKLRGGKTLCPKCSHTRKHKSDPCLSVDKEKGLFNCHNCDFQGSVIEFKPKREYNKPAPRLEKLKPATIKWFESRGISNDTLLRFGITEAVEWMPQVDKEMNCICFNYYRDEQLVNIKYRDGKKGFKMVKDAELIFYNLDSIKGETTCIIVEGEIDCLTLHECGIYNVISVPNGASKGSQKLEYLDNCWQYFEGMTKIILAVDNDEAGNSLKDELARRLGKEKCFTVEYPQGCKDVNDVLVAHSKMMVAQIIEAAKELPLEGIVTMDEMYPLVSEWYQNGYPKGAASKVSADFDEHLTFAPGQLTMVTGIPGHGKDEFINFVMANLVKHEDWSWGLCEFEEMPEQTVTKLIEKFTGKSFDFRININQRVSQDDFEYGVGMVDRYFSFIKTEDVQTDVDGILTKAAEMVKRYGIKGLRINPWNWLEHYRPANINETEYVSQELTKIVSFAKKYKVHVILIAHPTKIQKGKDGKYEIPTLYSISGSANFFNKTHNGITIYRNYETGQVDVYIQKVKQSWLGKIGFCSFSYDTYTRQYKPI